MPRNWVINGPTMVAVTFGKHIASGALPFSFPYQEPFSYAISGSTVININPVTGQGLGVMSGVRSIELGLSSDQISVNPIFHHKDIHTNAMGMSPADVQMLCAECDISMRLIHYDRDVLEYCIGESMCGLNDDIPLTPANNAGLISQAGSLMLGDLQAHANIRGGDSRTNANWSPFPTDVSGCHFMGLSLQPTNFSQLPENPPQSWYFYQSYLTRNPVVIPMGTEKSIVTLKWKALPVMRFIPFISGSVTYTPNIQFKSGMQFEIVSSGSYIWDHITALAGLVPASITEAGGF